MKIKFLKIQEHILALNLHLRINNFCYNPTIMKMQRWVILVLVSITAASCINKEKLRQEILDTLPTAKTTPADSSFAPVMKKPTTKKSGPLLVKTKGDIIDKIRRDYENFRTLKATAQIFFSNQKTANQNCLARIAYKRPGRLSIKSYKELVPEFFTIVMNYPKFWFYVPRYNTLYVGTLSVSGFSRGFEIELDPLLIEKALLAEPLKDRELADMKEAADPYYILSVFEMENGLKVLKRELWINRVDLTVEKETHFSAQGIPETEFLRSNFEENLYVSIPTKVGFRSTSKNTSVTVEYKNYLLNPPLTDEGFKFAPPAGVIIESVT